MIMESGNMSTLSDALDLVAMLRNAIADANARDGHFDYLIGEGINRQLDALGIEHLEFGSEHTFKIVRTTEGEDDCVVDNIEVHNLAGEYVFTLADDQYNPEGDLQCDSDEMIAFWLHESGQQVLAEYELDTVWEESK